MVKKYLAPIKDEIVKGPQMSQCIQSKHLELEIVLKGKRVLASFANGQIKQVSLLKQETEYERCEICD